MRPGDWAPLSRAVPVAVYVNGSRSEGVDALKSISARTVKEIRYHSPQEASSRFGPNNSSGVLEITLK